MQFFGHRNAAALATPTEPVGPAVIHDHADEAQIKSAYDRGRLDERRSRRRSPILALAVGAIALFGAVTLVTAAREGSFGGGGQLMDRQIAVAAGQAQVTGKEAVAATGDAVRDAGTNLRSAADRAS